MTVEYALLALHLVDLGRPDLGPDPIMFIEDDYPAAVGCQLAELPEGLVNAVAFVFVDAADFSCEHVDGENPEVCHVSSPRLDAVGEIMHIA